MQIKTINKQALTRIQNCYDPEHDIGPQAPIHWTTYELTLIVEKLVEHIEALELELNNAQTRSGHMNSAGE